MKKKILSLILAIAMILPVFCFHQTAQAATTKLIAFTFDDGSSNYTTTLLDGLAERGAKATFFVNGVNGSYGCVNHYSKIQRMISEGHEVANHTYSHHLPFTELSSSEMKSEVNNVNTYLFRAMGSEYQELVRIPGGGTSDTITASVDAPMIKWSIDPQDWKYRNSDTVYNSIMSQAFDGGIVLCHDIYPTSVDGALRAISALQAQGYECVTVSELFARRGITLQNGQTYFSAPNRGTTYDAYQTPTITVENGSTSSTCNVTMASATSGLTVYYTTDGSNPTMGSNKYTGTITVQNGTTITATAYDKYGSRSGISSVVAERVEPLGVGLNNEDYIDTIYATLLQRTASDAERTAWINALNAGTSRTEVMDAFLGSAEWANVCANVGNSSNSALINGFGAFVERLYSNIMNRKSDNEGMKYWLGLIASRRESASEVAYFFMTCSEFTGRNLNNSDFVEVLYNTFFNRASDTAGKDYWVSQLTSGASRESIIQGFIDSPEWKEVCASYNISIDGTPTAGMKSFVERMYTTALNRASDPDGASYWVNALSSKEKTATEIAECFFESTEFNNAGLDNAEFIRRLYATFMDRTPDSAGYSYWQGQMDSGMTRHQVMLGFLNSREFKVICVQYGINR